MEILLEPLEMNLIYLNMNYLINNKINTIKNIFKIIIKFKRLSKRESLNFSL